MKIFRNFIVCSLLVLIFASCGGEDFTPVYFPPAGEKPESPTTPTENLSAVCSVTFTSRLCVVIKGDKVEAGTDKNNPICTEVPAFPIHINGSEVTIKGDEFPDIAVEGNGLPVPIIINAKGNSDGRSNIASGPIDGDGNITVNNFSLYISALGMVGELPNLTFTTKNSEKTPHLAEISGSAPDTSGAMIFVTSTVIGHLFDAADAVLKGASMTATFTGAISPSLEACSGSGGEESLEISKIIVDNSGNVAEVGLADGKILEVSNKTYIAQTDYDIGEKYEGRAKFRITNISSNYVDIKIPPRIGSFYISSLEALTQTLSPNKSVTITVSFKPKFGETTPGEIKEKLIIGTSAYTLLGVAFEPTGNATIDALDENGDTSSPFVSDVSVGESEVPIMIRRGYFNCRPVKCEDEERISSCTKCFAGEANCKLLPLNSEETPLGEVNGDCSAKNASEMPFLSIDIAGNSEAKIESKKQILALRNRGAKPLNITDIKIENQSKVQEFGLLPGAVFIAKNYDSVKEQLKIALAEGEYKGTPFPFTLPVYHKGYDETTAYIIVTYEPKDLFGSDGAIAAAGNNAVDKATLKIITDTDSEIVTGITGQTVVKESPPLEVIFKTSTGIKSIKENDSFSFRAVTTQTKDVAYPMYLKTSNGALSSVNIISMKIEGDDAKYFELLDTAEKIKSKTPESGSGIRCSEPIYDSSENMIDEKFDLKPVSIGSSGFEIKPGTYTNENAPLFACVNFHLDAPDKKYYNAKLTITARELEPSGLPKRNPDGSIKELNYSVNLLSAINPRQGHLVMRITQTAAGILHPDFPAFSAIASYDEQLATVKGEIKPEQLQVFLASLILDPFDEMTVTNAQGDKTLSTPNDGVTAVFRALDTHPTKDIFDNSYLYDYASLTHEGANGLFSNGYENVPEDVQVNGWRIFTGTMSYPGPVESTIKSPNDPSECTVIDTCDNEQHKLFSKDFVKSGEKGACAFFYASGGRYDSPAFHKEEDMSGGKYKHPCDQQSEPQDLIDLNTGRYSIDGNVTVEEVGLRFFGPTIFHSPYGMLGSFRPLDEIFHMAFTTGVLKPQKNDEDPNVLPDEKIDTAKGEHKISLTDKNAALPAICTPKNVQNRTINGKKYSSWKYLKPLLSEDENGEIPAGCPEEDNDFKGGTAYIHGRPIDHETGVFTVVSAAKFGNRRELSFAFQNVMTFIIINGWLCDPQGSPEEFEGERCYDVGFNERDETSQISIMK